METPHESRMCPINFEVKRSRSQCINYWKWFPAHNYFLFTPIIVKLHMQTRHEARMCPIDLRVKGQGHSALISVNGFLRITAFPLHPWSQKLYRHTPPESRMCPIDFRVKRSRSQCINYWKWLLAHNCYPFIPMVTKLHRQTLHESRMCPIDLGNGFLHITAIPLHPWSRNFTGIFPIIQGCFNFFLNFFFNLIFFFFKEEIGDFDILKIVPAGGICPVRTDPDLVCISMGGGGEAKCFSKHICLTLLLWNTCVLL